MSSEIKIYKDFDSGHDLASKGGVIGQSDLSEAQIREELKSYSPQITFSTSKKGYTVKTAENCDELMDTLALRHEVFINEFIGDSAEPGIDYDCFDKSCDHLLIVHNESQRPVGTYRFRCSHHVSDFYTETEFDCSGFLGEVGPILEMGRACIHKDHRNGAVMNLLFRGLAEYIKQSKVERLFGCSSIQCEDPQKVAEIIATLRAMGAYSDQWKVSPLAKYQMDGLDEALSSSPKLMSEEEISQYLPGLLSAYVKAGARLVGNPAHDRDFKCIDVFTTLSVENLMSVFRKRYLDSPATAL